MKISWPFRTLPTVTRPGEPEGQLETRAAYANSGSLGEASLPVEYLHGLTDETIDSQIRSSDPTWREQTRPGIGDGQ